MAQRRTVYRRSPGSAPHHLIQHEENLSFPLPPTSILIRVRAVSLNYRDFNMLRGTNPWSMLEQGIPCSDASGEVLAIGSHVQRFQIGDKVCPIVDQNNITGKEQEHSWLGSEHEGVLASHVIFDEQTCVHFPDHLTWAEAACLPCAGVTAWSALADAHGVLTAGQTILLQGTGGVSLLALKLAVAAGCKTIITSSSDTKLESIRNKVGSHLVDTINYQATSDWDKATVKLNGGIGVDLVVENGGTSSIIQSLLATRKAGIVSQVGYLGQQSVEDLQGLVPLLIEKAINLRGINVGSRRDFELMNKLIATTELHFNDIIDKVFLFQDATAAFDYLQSGGHIGKVVIDLT